MAGYYDCTQARIVEGHCGSGRAVQQMQRHAVAPDGSPGPPQSPGGRAGDIGQGRERLGWGDGRGDGEGVGNGYDHSYFSG